MREKINLNDSFYVGVVVKISEGNPGALSVITKMINGDPASMMNILSLDDMNLRGSQIWVAYKDYCGESIELFMDCVKSRDAQMIEAVNITSAKYGTRDKAVRYGASSMKEYPVMTDEEMKKLAKKEVPVNPKISAMGE